MGEGDTDTDKKSKPLTKAQRAIVNAGTEIRLDRATAEDAAYLARQFVQATLPHSDPKADTQHRLLGGYAPCRLDRGRDPRPTRHTPQGARA